MTTEVSLTDDMKLIDVNGNTHELTKFQVRMIVITGWLTFLFAWIMNILFYMVHPSSVDVKPARFGDKCFIFIFGKKKSLFGFGLVEKGIKKLWKFLISSKNLMHIFSANTGKDLDVELSVIGSVRRKGTRGCEDDQIIMEQETLLN